MTSSPPVLLDVADAVATITLNRPEAMNGLDVATKDLLLETVRTHDAVPDRWRCADGGHEAADG